MAATGIALLPLGAAVHPARPLILGGWPETPLFSFTVLAAYCVAGFYGATILARRRVLK